MGAVAAFEPLRRHSVQRALSVRISVARWALAEGNDLCEQSLEFRYSLLWYLNAYFIILLLDVPKKMNKYNTSMLSIEFIMH